MFTLLLLVITSSLAFCNAQQLLNPIQSKLEQVVYIYPNEIRYEDQLPECEEAEVCSTEHKRYWFPPWIYRRCSCNKTDCSETVSALDNRSIVKVCKNEKEKLLTCAEREVGLEVRTENGNREIAKALCRCNWPKYWALSTHVENKEILHERYICQSFRRCKSEEFCGHIRSDTYSMYLQCACPEDNICLNKDKQERNITEALYQGLAMRAYCLSMKSDNISWT